MPTFNVQGMTCGHCDRAVTDAIRHIDSGAQVDVDLAAGTVRIDSQATTEQLAKAIRLEGYQAQPLALHS
jgi:copper chaperone